MTGGTLAAKQVELLKESFPDLPRLTVLGDSLSTAQLVGAEHATGWLGSRDSNYGICQDRNPFECGENFCPIWPNGCSEKDPE